MKRPVVLRALLEIARGYGATDAESRERARAALGFLTDAGESIALDADSVMTLACCVAAEVEAAPARIAAGADLYAAVLPMTDGSSMDVCDEWPTRSYGPASARERIARLVDDYLARPGSVVPSEVGEFREFRRELMSRPLPPGWELSERVLFYGGRAVGDVLNSDVFETSEVSIPREVRLLAWWRVCG